MDGVETLIHTNLTMSEALMHLSWREKDNWKFGSVNVEGTHYSHTRHDTSNLFDHLKNL
jgi:hypothetical protein